MKVPWNAEHADTTARELDHQDAGKDSTPAEATAVSSIAANAQRSSETGLGDGSDDLLLQLASAVTFGLYTAALYRLGTTRPEVTPQLVFTGPFDLQHLLLLFSTPLLVVGAFSILVRAIRGLRAGKLAPETPAALALVWLYGYSVYATLSHHGRVSFDYLAIAVVLLTGTLYLQQLALDRPRRLLRALQPSRAARAWRQVGQTWHEVGVAALHAGDVILVRTGQPVPADAEVLAGDASVREPWWKPGQELAGRAEHDILWAGSIVTGRDVVAQVACPADGAYPARAAAEFERIVAEPLPVQRLADRLAAHLVAGALLAAALTLAGWLLAGHSFERAALAAAAVLIAANPIALHSVSRSGLATVLARCALAGLLVRSTRAVPAAAAVETVVFDKGEALANGRPEVCEVVPNPALAMGAADVLCIAAAVEQHSAHAVGRAISNACLEQLPYSTRYVQEPGLGVSAHVNGRIGQRVKVGVAHYVGVDLTSDLAAWAAAHAQKGHRVVWVGWSETVAGFIALRDELHPTAVPAVRGLVSAGLRPVLFSGDHPLAIRAAAESAGVREFAAVLAPRERTARIKEWQEDGEQVAIVGGNGSAPEAMAVADLSIGIGRHAVEACVEAGKCADVLLANNDLSMVAWFISLARRAGDVVQENLGWAIACHMVVLPLAMFGVIGPAVAAVGMAGGVGMVLGNSWRLRRG